MVRMSPRACISNSPPQPEAPHICNQKLQTTATYYLIGSGQMVHIYNIRGYRAKLVNAVHQNIIFSEYTYKSTRQKITTTWRELLYRPNASSMGRKLEGSMRRANMRRGTNRPRRGLDWYNLLFIK